MINRIIAVFAAFSFALAGCSGGKGGSSSSVPNSSVTEVRKYYTNGQLKEHGFVVTGTTTKTRDWVFYFDNGQKRWEGTYAAGVVDDDKHWREWNQDGSIRDDQTD
jgi:hypothetical protein